MGTLIAIILVLALVVLAVYLIVKEFYAASALIAAIAVVGVIVYLFLTMTSIASGYVGVVYNRMGGLEQETLKPGWHHVGLTQKVTEYPVSTETVRYEGKEAFRVSTKDGKVVTAELMYSYHMDEARMPQVFAKFRGRTDSDIANTYMKDRLTAMIQSITSNYGVLEVYGDKRGEINQKIFDAFKADLDKVGIEAETFNFSKIEPDENSLKAIQSLVDSQLKLNQLKIEKDQAEVIAEKLRVEAKGTADAAVIKATGTAESNKKMQQSLTPELIQYEMATRWNGAYPMVTGGSTITNLPALPATEKK